MSSLLAMKMEAFLLPALLSALLVTHSFAQTNALELTLQRDLFVSSDDDACGQLTCLCKGNSHIVDSITLSRLTEQSGEGTQLLSVSASVPKVEAVFENIRSNGSLERNLGYIYVDLLEEPDCREDSFICKVSFVSSSGQKETMFTTVGPRQPPTSKPDSGRLVRLPRRGHSSQSSANVLTAELGFLGDKITRLEGKLQTLDDRLDTRVTQRVEEVDERVQTQGKRMSEKVDSVEDALSVRVTRLEDRLSALILAESPGSGGSMGRARGQVPEGTQVEVATRSDGGNCSRGLEEPTTCQRGMGDDVTRTYPAYVIMSDPVTQKQVLCDTHTDGGGWIVIQRRSKGDVDFYKDWTSYKNGFGSPTGDFWLGNDAIHTLTDGEAYELRLTARTQGRDLYSQYSSFRIENEENMYRLRLRGSVFGTTADPLTHHNNLPFTTFDRDNDPHKTLNCAIYGQGAWWYKDCYESNLNGRWGGQSSEGVAWKSLQQPLWYTEMKMRRARGPNGY